MIRIIKYLKHKAASPQINSIKEKPVIIKLEEARKDSELVKEMFEQLNGAFLNSKSNIEYEAGIKFRGHRYSIAGTYKEWVSFFGMDIRSQFDRK